MISLIDAAVFQSSDFDCISESLCFTGPIIDQRGNDLVALIGRKNKIIEVSFNVINYTVGIAGNNVPAIRLTKHLDDLIESNGNKELFLESTTLGFVEILLILKWFSKSKLSSMKVLYAEPEQYKSRTNYMSDFGRHEFDLSTHSGGFKAIPGFAKVLSQAKKAVLISSMGFERSRLGQLLNLDDGAYISSIIPIYGTPGFKAGWDKHSYFQNVEILNDKGIKPQFVSANSPFDMLKILDYIKESYQDDEITIAPLGTKPLSLASAIFLINNPGVTLKYDHPTRKSNRSSGLGKIHIYTIENNLT